VIDAKLGREDYRSIHATTIGRGLKPLNFRTDIRTRLKSPVDRKLVVETKNKIFS
jgi:hypothetical protein